jgi:type II secretory ATPase GspE/PulE/Tfp pilus assembly ATPase PilB-like protein
MPIRFPCPHCQAELEVPDEAAGREGKCSQCMKPITVPAAAPAPDDDALPEVDRSPTWEPEPSLDTPLPAGRHLKARRKLGRSAIVRGVAAIAALVGIECFRHGVGWATQLGCAVLLVVEGGVEMSQEWLQSAFAPAGMAPTLYHALLALGGVLLVGGGALGILVRKRARNTMLSGIAVVTLAHLAWLALPYLPLEDWVTDGVGEPAFVEIGVLLVVCAAVAAFLLRGGRMMKAVGDDVFANVTQIVHNLFEKAVESRASDVHIEPTSEGTVVRYRIDGVLHPVITYPQRAMERIASRIKVIADMDIAERRMPQDGGATVLIKGRSIDLRISTVPSSGGERVVVRILDREVGLRGLRALGMRPELYDCMERIVRSPHGMFFCTGPTGSGKTTTLYAALLDMDREGRNVITVEDPIEYHLPGITQLPVRSRKGMTFASSLRSILRQDPDVIMVGEVRDAETAKMAVQAAQTGHLVMSTVHTNDSAGAVSRLLDLEAEPSQLASSLMAVLAQRLVRRICPDCARDYTPSHDELARIGLPTDGSVDSLRKGAGCRNCMDTGYAGREGLYELLVVDRQIRQLILRRADSATINEHAVSTGMISLREDGCSKVLAGRTTIEEVARVTQGAIL